MGTLSVWKFDTAEGAGQAVGTLEDLAKQQLITILDAATVSWPEGAKRPKTRELHNLAGAGALRLAQRRRHQRRIHQEDPRRDHARHVGAVRDEPRRGAHKVKAAFPR